MAVTPCFLARASSSREFSGKKAISMTFHSRFDDAFQGIKAQETRHCIDDQVMFSDVFLQINFVRDIQNQDVQIAVFLPLLCPVLPGSDR
jgi:hypothetical protein